MKRLLIITLLTLTSFAFGESEAQYYQGIASEANGLTSQQQREATNAMNAGQAAGLDYAGPDDIAAALGSSGRRIDGSSVTMYNADQITSEAAAPLGSTYSDPSYRDPIPYRPTIQQNEAADASNPILNAGDPTLIQDTRAYSTQNLINNGAGSFVSAAQRMDEGLDKSTNADGSAAAMQNTRNVNGFAFILPPR